MFSFPGLLQRGSRPGALLYVNDSMSCFACRQPFTAATTLFAGHNKWSKVKHQKKGTDAKKSAARMAAAKIITMYSKIYGPNPDFNPKLAAAVTEAKKAGVPKANIDQAIERGQGRSSTGSQLETVTVEIMMPGGIAVIAELETDSRNKIKAIFIDPVRKNGGSLNSCAFFFNRRGRAVFGRKDGTDIDSVLDVAINFGAEDVEADNEGNLIVWCQPTDLSRMTTGLFKKLGLEVLESSMIWDPKSDMKVKIDRKEDASALAKLFSILSSEVVDLQGLYTNAVQGSITNEQWATIEEHINI